MRRGLRPTPDEIAAMTRENERAQLIDLLKAMDCDDSPITAWDVVSLNTEIPEYPGSRNIREADCILHVPGSGLVVIDFKSETRPKEVKEQVRKSVGQANQLWRFIQGQIKRQIKRDELRWPLRPPAIVPVLAAYNLDLPHLTRLALEVSIGETPILIGQDVSKASRGSGGMSDHDRAVEIHHVISQGFKDYGANYKAKTGATAAWSDGHIRDLIEVIRGWKRGKGLSDFLAAEIANQETKTQFWTSQSTRRVLAALESPEATINRVGGGTVRLAYVPGLAGTGKTWLGVELAVRSAARGEPTLFLCRSEPLKDFIQGQVNLLEDHVVNGDVVSRVRDHLVVANPKDLSASVDHGDGPDSHASWRELVMQNTTRYQTVVVDEAQDFGPMPMAGGEDFGGHETALDWILDLALPGGDALILADPSQATRADSPGATWEIPYTPSLGAVLDENLRCSAGITQFMIVNGIQPDYFSDETFTREALLEVEVVAPDWGNEVRDLPGLKGAVERVLLSLHQDLEIGDQSQLAGSRFVLLAPDQIWCQELEKELPKSARSVSIATIDEFKGLEREVVVLVVPDGALGSDGEIAWPYPDAMLQSWIYTGMSRAQGLVRIVPGRRLLPLLGE